MMGQYLLEKLRQPGTYVTTVVVGTIINLYGQALVPWLRGETDLVGSFLEECRTNPWVTFAVVGAAYVFPLIVGVYASVMTRWHYRHEAALAQFPDNKPDPVFRAADDGTVLHAGRATADLFARYGVRNAQDVVGAEAWKAIAGADGASTEAQLKVWFEPEQRWYLVAHSPAEEGGLNIYLTRVPTEPREAM